MVKTVLAKLLPILILIVIVIIFSVTYRFFSGLHIRHYNQYIIPCQGQRIAYNNYTIPLTFFVLDEVDISELSSKENIIMIYLNSDEGSIVQATNWEIQEGAGFYSGTEFFAKRLKVFATFTSSMSINNLEIVYLDKTEVFDVGELNIKVMNPNNYIAETQIFSSFLDLSTQDSFMNQNENYFASVMTIFSIQSNSFSEMGYQIQNINLGIEGLSINPSSLKMVNNSMDYGISFTSNPDNEVYIHVMNVDILPNPNIEINVGGPDSGYYYSILGLCKTDDFNSLPIVTYYCPIFNCFDIESNESFEFGDPNNVFIDTPYFFNDDYVRELVEDYGI